MPSLRKKISHLYGRAGFGISLEMLDQKSTIPLNSIVDQLLADAKKTVLLDLPLPVFKQASKEGITKMERKMMSKKLQQENKKVNGAWIQKMANSNNPLLERMTLFWHGHFALVSKNNSFVSKSYINTLRTHALGNFGDLVLAIARDPGMIRFLNNQQNKKGQPNENFARELLELFTIGIGHYSEQDIKEAARAFTGWRADNKGVFYFSKRRHDFGKKTFFGQEGDFNGEDIIRIILEKKETARFITTKIYKYFVNEKIDKNHIQALTEVFYNSNYSIEKLVRKILESDWFYADKNIGTKIKSPVDLLVGMMKTLDLKMNNEQSGLYIQKALGQILLRPPNVAGWSGGKAWIDNATLLFRLNLAGYFYKTTNQGLTVNSAKDAKSIKKLRKKISSTMDLSPIVDHFEQADNDEIFSILKDWLIHTNLEISKSEIDAFTRQDTKGNYVKSLVLRLMTLPEYQVC